MSGTEKFEREFEEFLNEENSRIAALYRKLPSPEPDARLDAAVRAMAHRALNPQLVATPRIDVRRRRRMRWISAFGAAAGIVLAAGIALRMGPSMNGTHEAAPASNDVISVRTLDAPASAEPPLSPPPPAAAPAPAGAASTAAAKAAPAAEAESVAPEAPAPQRQALRKKTVNSPSLKTEARAAPENALSRLQSAAKPAPQSQAFPAQRHKQGASSEMDAVERRQIMAAGAWQNLHDQDAAASAGRARNGEREDEAAEAQVSQSPAPATHTGLAPSAAAPAAPAAAAAEPAPVAAAAGRDEAQASSDARARTRTPARSNDPNARLYPEHWLANIRTMLEQGRRESALRSLAEFRRMYPDYRLPDDLRDLK